MFEQLFEQIVHQCVEVGLVQGKHLSVDGSFVEANAAKFAKAQRQRKKVEALFADLKNQIGLRRLRLRRLKFVGAVLPGRRGPKDQATRAVP